MLREREYRKAPPLVSQALKDSMGLVAASQWLTRNPPDNGAEWLNMLTGLIKHLSFSVITALRMNRGKDAPRLHWRSPTSTRDNCGTRKIGIRFNLPELQQLNTIAQQVIATDYNHGKPTNITLTPRTAPVIEITKKFVDIIIPVSRSSPHRQCQHLVRVSDCSSSGNSRTCSTNAISKIYCVGGVYIS